MRTLVAIPVYNEERHVREVLDRVLRHAGNVLVVDDGSTDATPTILREYPIDVIRHAVNRGYGRSMQDAFIWAASDGYDWVITMDCDAQHEPDEIPAFLDAAALENADVVSGSRYLDGFNGGAGANGTVATPRLGDVGGLPGAYAPGHTLLPQSGSKAGVSTLGGLGTGTARQDVLAPPPDRRAINATITAELNKRIGAALGVRLTDSFCGFKAYRVSFVKQLSLDVDGYAFPMQFWVQTAAAKGRVREIPVSLIYNDPNRTFGGPLDDPSVRLAHYREVMHREIRRRAAYLPASACADLPGGRCCCR